MKFAFHGPITYIITPGDATEENFVEKRETLLQQIGSAVAAGISLIQIREKYLDTRSLFSLVQAAAEIPRPSSTKVLVNDRVDVAVSAGADGVHLTTRSLPVSNVRRAFGRDVLIASSTHNIGEAIAAADSGADLIVFGPVFDSPGKGTPKGLEMLSEVCGEVEIPVLGLGGIDAGNFRSVLSAGAAGFAGIRCFSDPAAIAAIVGTTLNV